VPNMMRHTLSEEVVYDEIPFIRGQLISRGQTLREKIVPSTEKKPAPAAHAVSGHSAVAAVAAPQLTVPQSVVEFVDKEALPYLGSTNTRNSRLRDKRVSDDLFRLMRLQSPSFVHQALEQMQELCDEKRRIDIQVRLHRWLHSWLLVHAPASILLVVVTFWHAFVAVFTYA